MSDLDPLAAWQVPEPPPDFVDRVMASLPLPVGASPPRRVVGVAPRTVALLVSGASLAAAALTALVLRAPHGATSAQSVPHPIAEPTRVVAPVRSGLPEQATGFGVARDAGIPLEPDPAEPADPIDDLELPQPPHTPTNLRPTGPAAEPAQLEVLCLSRCTVYVDHRSRGTTPLRITDVVPGRHIVSVIEGDTGFVQARRLDMAPGQLYRLSIDTRLPTVSPTSGTGRLAISATPWAGVAIDGRDYGATPLAPIELPAGRHTVRISNPDRHYARTFAVDVAPGRTQRIREVIDRADTAHTSAAPTDGTGRLAVAVTPWGNVTIDGRDYGATPIATITLPAGRHAVRITNPDRHYVRTFTVEIRPGETRRLRYDLEGVPND